MTRGQLKVYLGAAPGVGKTFAMLGEGRRRQERGTDVAIGFLETHGRRLTALAAEGLPTVARTTLEHRGLRLTEMDVDAVIARRPEWALVDEIAHTNVPGSRNDKRWRDVEELLDAGINVITTLNVQHLESLNDVVETITGVRQRETIPDAVVRRADQIELVDMSPESLRRRLAHGNVYPPEKIDAALGNYFRAGNLTALRELALLWVADRVDEGLARYRADHDIEQPWAARERVVVAITGGAEGDTVIRRAARIASRGAGGELIAVHVARSDGLADASPRRLAQQRSLVEGLGGTYHQVVGDDISRALLDFARAVNATQVVLGSSRRNRWQHMVRPGVGTSVPQLAEDIDVHIVPHEHAGRGRLPVSRGSISRRRLIASWTLALAGPPLLTVSLTATRGEHGLSTQLLLFLALVVANALLGGLLPALVSAVVSSLLVNFYFTQPIYTFTIAEPENALALVIFVLVAAAVSSVVDLAARRTAAAARAGAEAETLATLAGSVLRGQRTLPALLERVREAFGMRSAALLERPEPTGGWVVLSKVGEMPGPGSPEAADADVQVRDGLVLALSGRVLAAADQRVLEAFGAHVGVVLEQQRLSAQAAETRRLAEANRVRTALLAAVSHDLRTPIAAIKASVGTLRQDELEIAAEDRRDLLAGIEESSDRLARLVGNLLDMSRVQAGAVTPLLHDITLDEVVPTALLGIPDESAVKVNLPEDLPAVRVDPGLLERVIANIVENAVLHNPPGAPVTVSASSLGPWLEVRVLDRGQGVPDEAKERIFEPFQRLGDAPSGSGVGLGLAVARGFAEIMGGSLRAEDTPGGGLTLVLTLPIAAPEAPEAPEA